MPEWHQQKPNMNSELADALGRCRGAPRRAREDTEPRWCPPYREGGYHHYYHRSHFAFPVPCVPGTVLIALHQHSHLLQKTSSCCRDYKHLHFPDSGHRIPRSSTCSGWLETFLFRDHVVWTSSPSGREKKQRRLGLLSCLIFLPICRQTYLSTNL